MPAAESAPADSPNIIIIVFDALSSLHLPVYGYSRATAPNLTRFAESATVYHNHFAGGNFTTPGTASLLTGTYPFTHRAFPLNNRVIPEYEDRNIFSIFPDYNRVAYTHNVLADKLLKQFDHNIDIRKRRQELLINGRFLISRLFEADNDIAQLSWIRVINTDEKQYTNSLFLSGVNSSLNNRLKSRYQSRFPRGLPEVGVGESFLLESATDWIYSQLSELPKPFLGYFHMMPPHQPYNTPVEYIDAFLDDGYSPVSKPYSIFSLGYPQTELNDLRRYYDEYILYADQAFGNLYQMLGESNLLDNTWLIFTSDHGEMFERGIWKHITQTLYDPILHIPLLIQAPGQVERQDIYTTTSAIDLLPTLQHLHGKPLPDWCEGKVLPPYNNETIGPDRSIFALEAKKNLRLNPLKYASTMLLKWPLKLVEYRGYEELEGISPRYEMYDLENDLDELTDIYDPSDKTVEEMVKELRATLAEADLPYEK
jgi:arylsulfatase A-like enzyme